MLKIFDKGTNEENRHGTEIDVYINHDMDT